MAGRAGGGYWSLSLYPGAGEAGGSFVSIGRASAGVGGDPDADRSAFEAARRARGKVRRFCAENRLNRLGTLTYREACFEPLALREDLARFFRLVRDGLGAGPLPYLWVPEWHPGGHGLHAHFTVGRYVPRTLIAEAWGRGFVHIKQLGNLPAGSGSLEEARLAGRYVSKYVTKDVDADREGGLHRYEVAEGFQPEKVTLHGRSPEDVIGQASDLMGRAPSYVWFSSQEEVWRGPPACWVQWS